MKKIVHITPEFAVSAALTAKDFAEAAAMGFKSILSNLPDGESQTHLTSREAATLADQADVRYRHIPAIKSDIFNERTLESMEEALRELPRPILAHCASGLRSAIAWAAVAARTQSTESVLAKLRAAGLDLEMIRDDLDALGGQRHQARVQPALEATAA
jgi:sulfide:quinone oxidoreductase